MTPQSRETTALATRSALGIALGLGAAVLGARLHHHPALSLLDLPAAAAFAAALVGGWPGWAGALAASVVLPVHAAPGGAPWGNALLALAQALPGALAWLAFRHLPGLGRSIPDLRSYLALFATAALGSLASGALTGWLYFPQQWLAATAIAAAGTGVGLLLLVPPLLLAGSFLPRGWPAPLPGERRRHAHERSVLGLEPWQTIVLGAAMVVTVTGLVVLLSGQVPGGERWLNLLYLIPILWGATNDGLRGGLLAASAVGIFFLAARPLIALGTQPVALHEGTLGAFPALLLFCLVGSLLGAAADREADLRDDLAASNRRLRQDLERVVRALTGALEAKDSYTNGHLARVSDFAVAVGRHLGLDAEQLEHLRCASRLHDVGKIGIPERVLNKPGPLDTEELEVMQRHAEIGARILDGIDGLAEAAPLVRHHQERYDGRRDAPFPGYPEGLCGDQIPLGARIIAAVDAFDAMTTDRPYRPSRSPEEAVAELQRERGTQFDPRVVDALVEVLARHPWS